MYIRALTSSVLNAKIIKGEGDTALEAEAQLYSYIIDLKIMQVKGCK